MANFPRRGIELSDDCEVLFTKARHLRAAVVRRFENGSKEARFRAAKGLYHFEIVVTVANGAPDDFGVITDFIELHGVVTPFTIDHPDYGVGTATLLQTEHEIERVVSGNPSWFRIAIPVEAAI